VCPQHTGFAKSKADRYWSLHKGALPFPKTVDEFLDRAGELRITAEVQIKWGGKWPEIVGRHAGEAMGEPVPANENGGNLTLLRRPAGRPSAARFAMMDDEIPF
jgi:DNA repair protein RadD